MKKLRWKRVGVLLGGMGGLVFAMVSFVSADASSEEHDDVSVVLSHPGRVEMAPAGMNPSAATSATKPGMSSNAASEEAPRVRRDEGVSPKNAPSEEVLPCACNKRVIPLPRNPYTAHRASARTLPNSFFVKDEAELRGGLSRGNLVNIRDGRGYHVAPLRDSHMLLLPEVRDLLVDIGHAFADELEGTPSEGTRLRITSLTRTDEQQRRLSRRNYNAINQSTHSYGASFDVAFIDRPDNRANCSLPTRAAQKVLQAFQREGKILVIPEGNCFHITLRRVY